MNPSLKKEIIVKKINPCLGAISLITILPDHKNLPILKNYYINLFRFSLFRSPQLNNWGNFEYDIHCDFDSVRISSIFSITLCNPIINLFRNSFSLSLSQENSTGSRVLSSKGVKQNYPACKSHTALAIVIPHSKYKHTFAEFFNSVKLRIPDKLLEIPVKATGFVESENFNFKNLSIVGPLSCQEADFTISFIYNLLKHRNGFIRENISRKNLLNENIDVILQTGVTRSILIIVGIKDTKEKEFLKHEIYNLLIKFKRFNKSRIFERAYNLALLSMYKKMESLHLNSLEFAKMILLDKFYNINQIPETHLLESYIRQQIEEKNIYLI